MEAWTAAIAAGVPFEMTFPLRAADGTFRRFLTRIVPLRDDDGRVVQWFGTNTDIEAERVARDEAERLRAVAEEANRAKSQFLSTMSHELRTPLNTPLGYTELLAMGVRGPVTEAQAADLERIRRANQHLLSLITDVLNFARLEAGRLEYVMADVASDAIMVDVAPLVEPQAAAKGIALDLSNCVPDPSRPRIVRADPERLRQVLINLITNAIKFTDAGGRVSLSCTRDDRARTVRLEVTDTGRGIPTSELPRIFEPFVQIDRHATAASQQGVGLGLAISANWPVAWAVTSRSRARPAREAPSL